MEEENKGVELNEDVLKRFIKVQKKIESYNSYGTFQSMRDLEEQVETLKNKLKNADRDFKVLNEHLSAKKVDLKNIKSKKYRVYFLNDQDQKEMISEAQKEFEISAERLNAAEIELKKARETHQMTMKSVGDFTKNNKRAIELYREQMMILNSQFDGDDGSDLENELEALVNKLEKEKVSLKSAINRWNNSRFLVIYACGQIQCAETQWQKILNINMNDPQKVFPAQETINNITACHSNLESVRKIISNITLPFCSPEEINDLVEITNHIYTDMEDREKQNIIMAKIGTFRKSCDDLRLWFEKVISETLVTPYAELVNELRTSTQNLRVERIRLIQEKIKEHFGKEVDLVTLDKLSEEKEDCLEEQLNAEMEDANLKLGTVQPEHRPLDFELPPPPSRDQLLGDAEQIRIQYRENTQVWNKHLEESKKESDLKLQRMLSQFSSA